MKKTKIKKQLKKKLKAFHKFMKRGRLAKVVNKTLSETE